MSEFDPNHYSVSTRWIFPVSSPPVEHGVIEIADGVIVAIHNRPDANAVNLGNAAIIPGLINAHAHLEFSDLPQPVQPPLPFTEWIRSLVGVRRATPATSGVIQQGLSECHSRGTAALGEISTQDWSSADYSHQGLHVTAFRELIGLRPELAASQLDIAKSWLKTADSRHMQLIRGLSPHAPYTVHPDLYRDLVRLATECHAPVAVHLAETPSELELLHHGTGEFVEMLKRFHAWDESAIPRGTRALDYLLPLATLDHALVVHGNYLHLDELKWVAEHPQVSVVYCPRTHAFFQHTPHPWLQLLELGGHVALGTDSRGSNPDLSLWGEMAFLVSQFPQVDPARILELGTLAGARSLGLQGQLGSIQPGKVASLAVVELPPGGENDPHRVLFSGAAPLDLVRTLP